MFKIKLTFCSGRTIELFRVDCSHGQAVTITSIRGRSAGAYRGVGTFHWSSAVRAVACLFLKAKLGDENVRMEPMLSGGPKSLAASLDYAITKQPGWILDMFGVSPSGKVLAKRLFHVTNSHRKRGGLVSISLNPHVCPEYCIEIAIDGDSITCPERLRSILEAIEKHPRAEQSSGSNERRGTGEEGRPTSPLNHWESVCELEAA
jgi:hypothetical protein